MRFEIKRTSIGDGFRGADGVAQILPGTQVPPGTTLRPPGPNVVFEGLLDRPGTAWAGNIAAPCAPDAAPRRKASGDRDPDWGSRPSRGDTLE